MSTMCCSNPIPVSSCTYSSTDHSAYSPIWAQRDIQNQWTLLEEDVEDQVTAPREADAKLEEVRTKDNRRMCTKDHPKEVMSSKSLKNSKKHHGLFKHVPLREKSPQIVAKRNARERRRVQAVNSAFLRLSSAVPIHNTRGKRVSKVKTLQGAIDYIQRLQRLLEETEEYSSIYYKVTSDCSKKHECCYQTWIIENEL